MRLRALWLLGLAACSASQPTFRKPDLRNDEVQGPASPDQTRALWSKAETVFATRCVVCHGCYDAPCQLKLETLAGVQRGATSQKVYESSRLTAAKPTRLSIDAHLVSEWRAKGFHSVLPELPGEDPSHSVLMRMLELKRDHPLTPDIDVAKTFSLGLERDQECAKRDDFDAYAKKHPMWGMPYALPAIEPDRQAALVSWIGAGAPAPDPATLSPQLMAAVQTWEEYFNQASPKERLRTRYLYEHLFLASLYFKGIDDQRFFRLVRSHTPSGFPVDEIPTRRPFEDPGPDPFYYRLAQRDGPKLAKTHMPYALDEARLARFRELFDRPQYEVNALPSYDLKVSANPLRAFGALPIESRYRFMLDEAEFTLMGFIKGPVCRGQVALNVIQERFWITFLDPRAPYSEDETEILRSVDNDLELPAESGSNAWLTHWFGMSDRHLDYVDKKAALFTRVAKSSSGIDAGMIWDGDGANSNAALTVFRHFDSATVVRGLVGGPPKTAWVVDYPMLERIHYLLVAGFDVYGNVAHQLMSRLYMDFLRMEGEANLLAFLPTTRRKQLADAWYRDVSKDARERIEHELTRLGPDPKIAFHSAQPELELFGMLESRLEKVRDRTYDLAR
ncbi:MAG TPA: fatty acid cis/trans isomerase, partial [Polyangiales bacterium]